jgi:hypothetical protein
MGGSLTFLFLRSFIPSWLIAFELANYQQIRLSW